MARAPRSTSPGSFPRTSAAAASKSSCSQCLQAFRGAVDVALARARWLHFTGRGETSRHRQNAEYALGATLINAGRNEEALIIQEALFATRRRLYGLDDRRTIQSEETIAVMKVFRRGAENLESAIEVLTRIYAWKIRHVGRDSASTLNAAVHTWPRLCAEQGPAAIFPRRSAFLET